MPGPSHYLAIDLGASSGRAVLGALEHGRLSLHELHRFPNGPIEQDGLRWDAPKLLEEIIHAITLAAREGVTLRGIGIDTWGVDYGLLDEAGRLLALPHHYRDPRTRGRMGAAARVVPPETIYARTGIQFLELNTLYQLLAERDDPQKVLARARRMLLMPDLLNYWLTGRAACEETNASTTQLFDTGERAWAKDLVNAFDLPAELFPEVLPPGTALGPLREEIAQRTRAGPVPVILPGTHDTASAVAGTPGGPGRDWAYISSGTWSLVGRELASPLRTAEALAANFTNECGVAGTIRFHKNVAGLWLLQECQRHWESLGRPYTHEQLQQMAAAAPPLAALVDPDDASFAGFTDMPQRLREFCARTGQSAPTGDGAIVRCILESVALRCAGVIESLESLTGPVRAIHLVGGGSRNELLCRFTADAAGRPVLAGPVEATAAGNIMVQAMADGRAGSLAEIRAVIASSFPPVRYEPGASAPWRAARQTFGSRAAGAGRNSC